MNILFFTILKHNVVYVYDDFTIKEALDKMESSHFAAIPILNRAGNYVGTLTEGDILRTITSNGDFNIKNVETIPISKVPRFRDNQPIHSSAKMQDLIIKATNQNFIPVVDDEDMFIGIVTRKDIINYFFEHNFIVL